MSEDFLKYFPQLTDIQKNRILELKTIYDKWNQMINVISRKDMDNFYLHHVLHSMAIGKIISFKAGTTILDVGTGGGFPGIPLAILFPDSEFTLLDSISKKIKVVMSVKEELGLDNVLPVCKRAEEIKDRYHFVVSRAVAQFPEFVKVVRKNIHTGSNNELPNGIIYLKGGDLTVELAKFHNSVKIWKISKFFNESFFETKKIIYMPV